MNGIQKISNITEIAYESIRLDEKEFEFNESDNSLLVQSSIATYIYAYHYAGDPSLFDPTSYDSLQIIGFRINDREFHRKLMEINSVTHFYDGGWQLTEIVSKNKYYVTKNDLTLSIDPNVHLREPSIIPNIGDDLDVKFPNTSYTASAGFFSTFSKYGTALGSDLVRIYLNLTDVESLTFLQDVLSSLNDLPVPYTCKVISDPSRFDRKDTSLLYFDKANYGQVLEVLSASSLKYPNLLGESTPFFTFEILKGIAVAEEPELKGGVRMSFGQHRSNLIAEGIVNAAKEKINNDLDYHIKLVFEKNNVCIEKPYLSSISSTDIFAGRHE